MAASEEDKRLIGDIAPKKLDPSVTPVVEPVSTSSTQVSSTLIFFFIVFRGFMGGWIQKSICI